MNNGYFRAPTVHQDRVVFVSEDDLWQVNLKGGAARRLTAGGGAALQPVFSPDGQSLAFSSEEEGHREIYVCGADGGEVRRVTYFGSISQPVAWTPDGQILFRSRAKHPHGVDELFQVGLNGGVPQPLRLGPAVWMSISSRGEVAIERNSHRPDPAHWKRYRGGTAGVIWVSDGLDQTSSKPYTLKSNLARPMWIGDRLYFLSDHEGVANIYSSKKDGSDLKRHTQMREYYARNPQTDGRTVVFHAGGDLFALDIQSDRTHRIEVDYRSQRTLRQRKFVSTAKHLESYGLSPKGDSVQITSRGQVFAFKNFEGPVHRYGQTAGVRYRLADWLEGGKQLVAVSDEGGAEHLEVYNDGEPGEKEAIKTGFDFGRITFLQASPKGRRVALTNHRNELVVVDLETKSAKVADRSDHAHLESFEWSPDGRMIAFRKTHNPETSYIAVHVVDEGKTHRVTEPLLHDHAPSWDPEGRYLYFLSTRILDPVYDNAQFELSFPRAVVPCLVTLRRDLPSPFLIPPSSEATKTDEAALSDEATKKTDAGEKNGEKKETKSDLKIQVDFDGITDRVQAFPVADGRYLKIRGLAKSKVAWTLAPIKGALKVSWLPTEPEAENRLEVYDFETRKAEVMIPAISGFDVSGDRQHVIVRIGRDLRIVKAGEKPDEKEPKSVHTKKSGWLDLDRVRILVEPAAEWRQMLHEVWRLQRDHFWDQGMSRLDWPAVLPKYARLVDRINTRSEFSDLVWEVQGELGTSHAYDIGGDYRPSPHYGLGHLGADYVFDPASKGYRITNLIRGDLWRLDEGSPLLQPGVGVQVGDVLTKINGETLSAFVTPQQMLLNRAGDELELTVLAKDGGQTRKVRVRTVKTEAGARYRDWVESNRAFVDKTSRGQVGYVHIPDMGARGFSEFHRSFLAEYDHDALIVDVRHNGGGHVSQLLLEKLARPRLGVSSSRWFGNFPEPSESPAGPVVALTNEFAGSDGDIFSHTYKMRKLGPLIGKRTWGGVVGIWPRHMLVDGSVTTQPEYATWFSDVKWGLENYGVDPDIDVEFAPHDHRQGHDPQLARAVEESLRLLKAKPAFRPEVIADVDMRPPELR